MTTDGIFFLSKMGKAGIWGRPAPWPGWGSSLQNGCRCPKFPSSEHHPLPLISIWEMGGRQWNYCITKLARTHFLWGNYCAEYTNSSHTTSPIKCFHWDRHFSLFGRGNSSLERLSDLFKVNCSQMEMSVTWIQVFLTLETVFVFWFFFNLHTKLLLWELGRASY